MDGGAGATTSALHWKELIAECVGVVWPELPDGVEWIVAQCQAESAGDPMARSSSGACGLLQLMPATAAEVDVANIFDPADNLHGGVAYLHRQYLALGEIHNHLDRLLWSFASYNGGRGYVNKALELARKDDPEWWRWGVGRFWLMHRDLWIPRGSRQLRPDYRQMWSYVARIRTVAAHLGAFTGGPL